MAIWKEIRKALNSTLGTSNFKPLDKLFYNYMKTYLNSTIDTDFFKPLDELNQYRLVVSDNLYNTFSFSSENSGNITPGTLYKSKFSLTFGTSGTVKISQNVSYNAGQSGQSCYVALSKNPNLTSSSDSGLVWMQSGYEYFSGESSKVTIDVAKGEKIYFYMWRGGVYSAIPTLTGTCNIYADVESNPLLVKGNSN